MRYMSRLYDCKFRVLLIIDDLDRCQQDRIMGVLSAVTLLLEPRKTCAQWKQAKTYKRLTQHVADDSPKHEDSPYISVLAIDPRVLLAAIEKHFDPDKHCDANLANVNGWVIAI